MGRQGALPTEGQWSNFFEALEETGNISGSAKHAKIAPRTVYNHRKRDKAFAKKIEESLEVGADRLEAVARARAEKSSDVLLIFLLKGLRPEKYRENYKHEVAGPGGGPIEVRLVADERLNEAV